MTTEPLVERAIRLYLEETAKRRAVREDARMEKFMRGKRSS